MSNFTQITDILIKRVESQNPRVWGFGSNQLEIEWRRGWDSNPRSGLTHSRPQQGRAFGHSATSPHVRKDASVTYAYSFEDMGGKEGERVQIKKFRVKWRFGRKKTAPLERRAVVSVNNLRRLSLRTVFETMITTTSHSTTSFRAHRTLATSAPRPMYSVDTLS